MILSDYLIFILLLINTILGVGIFLRNPRNSENKLYAAFVASVSIWILSNFLENEPEIVGIAALPFFLKLDFTAAFLFHYLWFRFASVFAESVFEKRSLWWLRALTVVAAIPVVLGSFWGDLLITNIAFADGVIQFEGGFLWSYYALCINVLMISGLGILFWGRRRAKQSGNTLRVRQINLVFLGSAVSLGIAMDHSYCKDVLL